MLEYYLNFTQALCQAIDSQNEISEQTKPLRIVAVSSGGKGRAQNAGAISALHAMEKLLDPIGADIKYLRCGNFMENLLWQMILMVDRYNPASFGGKAQDYNQMY